MELCGVQEESASFWKKKQKLLSIGVRVEPTTNLLKIKVFWFFFSKKNCLPTFLHTTRHSNTPPRGTLPALQHIQGKQCMRLMFSLGARPGS
jgi:hypothetical protein